MFLKRRLKNLLRYLRHRQKNLNTLLETFELNNYQYAIVGGVIKCACEDSTDIRDIDIIVDTNRYNLEDILRHYGFSYKRNNFGRFKIQEMAGTFVMSIDVWTLEDHYPFKVWGCSNPQWKDLPKSAWISTGGAAYLPMKRKLYAKELRRTLKSNTVHFYNKDLFTTGNVDNKYIIVAKLLYLYKVEEFRLDKDCNEVLHWYFSKKVRSFRQLIQLIYYLDEHYGARANWRTLVYEADKMFQV